MYTDPVRYQEYKTKKDTKAYYEKQIRDNPNLLNLATKRAEEEGLPIDSVIRMEAAEMMGK